MYLSLPFAIYRTESPSVECGYLLRSPSRTEAFTERFHKRGDSTPRDVRYSIRMEPRPEQTGILSLTLAHPLMLPMRISVACDDEDVTLLACTFARGYLAC